MQLQFNTATPSTISFQFTGKRNPAPRSVRLTGVVALVVFAIIARSYARSKAQRRTLTLKHRKISKSINLQTRRDKNALGMFEISHNQRVKGPYQAKCTPKGTTVRILRRTPFEHNMALVKKAENYKKQTGLSPSLPRIEEEMHSYNDHTIAHGTDKVYEQRKSARSIYRQNRSPNGLPRTTLSFELPTYAQEEAAFYNDHNNVYEQRKSARSIYRQNRSPNGLPRTTLSYADTIPQEQVAQPQQDPAVTTQPHDPVTQPQNEQRICRSTPPLIGSGHEINEKGREVRFSRRVRNEPATEPQKTVAQPQDLVVLPHQDPVASKHQEEQRICRSTPPLIGSGHEINEKGREVRFSRRVRNRRKKD
jgi:hypothetical protein